MNKPWREVRAQREQLLTADDLAKRWQVSKAHVYRLAREGKIPSVNLGRFIRFRLDQIEEWELRSELSQWTIGTSGVPLREER